MPFRALSITSEEADRLARELVALTRETLTDAVTQALRERIERTRQRDADAIDDLIDRLQARVAAVPVLDDRTPDEIIGYGKFGQPI